MELRQREQNLVPVSLHLGEAEIHIWRLCLKTDERLLGLLKRLLSSEETLRATGYHFERDCRRFVVRRAALRQILAQYMGCDASTVRFITSAFGRPTIADATNAGELSFSCSHSEDRGLVAVTRGRSVGVDLEKRRPRDANLEAVIGMFSPAEREELCRAPLQKWSAAFFDCWTCKEAFVKALGLGLSLPLDRFTISHFSGDSPELTRCDAEFTGGKRWTLLPLDLGADYSAAIVVEGDTLPIRHFDWEAELSQDG